jgi:uncharacterized protein (DUF433 family)
MTAEQKASLAGVLSADPEIMHGTPCFTGTRVPVQTLLDYIEEGDTLDNFLRDFSTVKRDQAVQFLDLTRQPVDFVRLYRRAFEQFGVSALWSSRPVSDPTPADALAITHTLRVEGNLEPRRLAEEIERACRAALASPSDFAYLEGHGSTLRPGR